MSIDNFALTIVQWDSCLLCVSEEPIWKWDKKDFGQKEYRIGCFITMIIHHWDANRWYSLSVHLIINHYTLPTFYSYQAKKYKCYWIWY